MNTTMLADPPIIASKQDPDLATPFDLGVIDAQEGNLCVPEMYYINWYQMVEYAKGYVSVVGPTFLSEQFFVKETA